MGTQSCVLTRDPFRSHISDMVKSTVLLGAFVILSGFLQDVEGHAAMIIPLSRNAFDRVAEGFENGTSKATACSCANNGPCDLGAAREMNRPSCGTMGPSTPSKACLLTILCAQWCQRARHGLATRCRESTRTTSGWPSSAAAGVKMGPWERCADRQELHGVQTRRIAQTSQHLVLTLTMAG